MNTIWVVVAFSIAGVVIAIVAALRRSNAPESLGAVSDQWISEHRLGATQDSRR